MNAPPRSRGSITLIEAVLAGLFLLGLAITLLILTDRTREKALDHAIAEQLTELHSISVDFDLDDTPYRAIGRYQTLKEETVELLLQLEPLRYLNLNHCREVRKYLDRIATHPAISELALVGTDIDDSALQHVASMEDLNWLDLRRADITNDGVKHLQACTSLVQLNLDETLIDDGVALAVRELPSLQRLTIRLTRVTDDGLRALATVPQLREIDVSGAQISQEALSVLRSARPNLKILCRPVNRIGAGRAERNKWAQEQLSRMGAILPNGRTAIPADVGNEAAFALMYSQSRVVMARDSQLTDAAAPMLLASSAAAIDVEGTAMTWGPNESVNNDQSIIRNLLNLSRTHVNDASLKNGLPFAAREIRFSDTQIGDEGVRALSDNTTPYHRYWSVIALDGTQITDGCEESLKQLMLLPHMKRINLRKTRLSGDVIERLRKVSPLVELVWDEPETRSSSE